MGPSRSKYLPPKNIKKVPLDELRSVAAAWKGAHQAKLNLGDRATPRDSIFYEGDLALLSRPCVSVVGSRNVTPKGAARARRLARELAKSGVVVISGLAAGVDKEALTAAIEAGGSVIAVIGTPIDKASPVANAPLQEEIYRNHLLISQFEPGSRVYPSNFPVRNRLMASLSLGTAIIEASDESGTLHQAAECTKLGRWLFITQSVIEDKGVSWPSNFLGYKTTVPLKTASDITSRILP